VPGIKQGYTNPRDKYIVIPGERLKRPFRVNLTAAVKQLKEIILAIFFYRPAFFMIVVEDATAAYMHKLNLTAQAGFSQNYRDKTICQQSRVFLQLAVIDVAPAGNADAINDYFRAVFLNQFLGVAETIYYRAVNLTVKLSLQPFSDKTFS